MIFLLKEIRYLLDKRKAMTNREMMRREGTLGETPLFRSSYVIPLNLILLSARFIYLFSNFSFSMYLSLFFSQMRGKLSFMLFSFYVTYYGRATLLLLGITIKGIMESLSFYNEVFLFLFSL